MPSNIAHIDSVMGKLGLPAPIAELSARRWDAIIVGAGHNGLTCAAYLGKAGKQVLVLEARERIGGACTSASAGPARWQNPSPATASHRVPIWRGCCTRWSSVNWICRGGGSSGNRPWAVTSCRLKMASACCSRKMMPKPRRKCGPSYRMRSPVGEPCRMSSAGREPHCAPLMGATYG